MEIYQLRTFMAVAHQGSITRASEQLFLSQPAVSAHIKSLEDELGITLFERTTKGMTLTSDGSRLLSKANQVMEMHRELLDEARQIKGRLTGTLHLGTVRNPSASILSQLLGNLSVTCPEVEVVLHHGPSMDISREIVNGSLDAGFFVTTEEIDENLKCIEVQRFGIYLAAPPGLIKTAKPIDWTELSNLPWACPISGTCCGRVAEDIFQSHGFRPQKIINVDQESVTRTLVAGGVGIGLLHEETALDAERNGEVELLGDGAQREVLLVFSYLKRRSQEPIIEAATASICELAQAYSHSYLHEHHTM